MTDERLPEHIATLWRAASGLVVSRSRSKSDREVVSRLWLAMNQLTGLSKAELELPSGPWIDAAKQLPPVGLAPNKQPCFSGWSPWVVACDVASTLDDLGSPIFTASYSHELARWHNQNNDRCQVTHWRDDITAPTPPQGG